MGLLYYIFKDAKVKRNVNSNWTINHLYNLSNMNLQEFRDEYTASTIVKQQSAHYSEEHYIKYNVEKEFLIHLIVNQLKNICNHSNTLLSVKNSPTLYYYAPTSP